MYCSACGSEVPDDARFCQNCGAAVGRLGAAEAGSNRAPVRSGAAAVPPSPPPPAQEGRAAPHLVAPPIDAQMAARPPAPIGLPSDDWGGRTTASDRASTSRLGTGGSDIPGGPGTPGVPGGSSASRGSGPPGGSGRRSLWIGVAAAAVVIIAVAIAVPMVLARGGEHQAAVSSTVPTVASTTTTTTESTTTNTTEQATTTTAAPSSTTTVTTSAGLPSDSAGKWVEVQIPGAPPDILYPSLSDKALVMETQTAAGPQLWVYKFDTGDMVQLPIDAPEAGGADIDGFTVVWWEGTYDDATASFTDRHIYSYDLVEGRKTEVVGGGNNVGYPQVAGMWVTWTEGNAWDVNPEEYMLTPIYGSLLSSSGGAANEPVSLAPSAVAPIIGDATWTYSLGENFLAWEQGAAVGGLDTGTYVLDLIAVPGEPRSIGSDAWRPSVSGDRLVYWENGLRYLDLKTGEKGEIDPKGDFGTAGPTYAAYFRSVDRGDAGGYEIVARGFTSGYEQVLVQQADPPWLSLPIAASGNRVAFMANGTLHVFEWKGQ